MKTVIKRFLTFCAVFAFSISFFCQGVANACTSSKSTEKFPTNINTFATLARYPIIKGNTTEVRDMIYFPDGSSQISSQCYKEPIPGGCHIYDRGVWIRIWTSGGSSGQTFATEERQVYYTNERDYR